MNRLIYNGILPARFASGCNSDRILMGITEKYLIFDLRTTPQVGTHT